MSWFRPRSILQLTIIGYLLVAGILIITLYVTARDIDGLTAESERLMSLSARAMTASRTLQEQSSAMERNARQYSVVGNNAILAIYDSRRDAFLEALALLQNLALGDALDRVLRSMARNEQRVYEAMQSASANDMPVEAFPGLIEEANQVVELISAWIAQQPDRIRQDTAQTKRQLTLQSLVLVSMALILAAVFTVLISAPLLQIERAIRQLGSGHYQDSVRIHGPRDLVQLGQQLDWLRGRLAQLEQQRSSFLRHVSHELKTPLAAMKESASLLHDGVVGELTQEQKDIILIQRNNCERLQALIDDLLRHNADSFAVLNSMPMEVELDEVVLSVLAAHELALKTAGLRVHKSLEKVTVKGNPEQLRVVVDNLFSNALKWSPEAGQIDIYLQVRKGSVQLGVIDQGPGVPDDEVDSVFEAFVQGRLATENNVPGNGLGLAISREYAQANGGDVLLMPSRAGAHFRLELPTDASSEQGKSEE